MTHSVSVIITTYNSPNYLERVLEGHLAQTVPPGELLVADDGSGPDTARVVGAFALEVPFPVRHVWQEDLGFRAARIRNRAVAAATGDYLVFTDGDCIPHPRFIEDHRRLAKPGWFVQGKRMLVNRAASERFVPHGTAGLLALWRTGGLSGVHHLVRVPGFAPEKKGLKGIKTCNLGVFRSDLLAINGFNEDFVGWGREDSEMAARLFALGLRRKDPPFSAVVFHLWHGENPRTSLPENDRRLAETVRSGVRRCKNGIEKIN